MQSDKPKVDMSFCFGNIEKMLEVCKTKLSAADFCRLRDRVLSEESYKQQKEIFSEYVKIIIK